MKDKGRVVEMARQDEKTLTIWLMGTDIRKEGERDPRVHDPAHLGSDRHGYEES